MTIQLYEHNKKAYDNVRKTFETENRTCVIHPTGTGKAFISIKWLYDNRDKKCIFLAPSYPIIDQLLKHIESCGLTLADFPNLSFEIYYNVSEKVARKNYDCIVLDEFHRCGAHEWNKGIDELLENNKDAKVLGLSATPVRYLDDNRDMSKELFNGNVASHMSLAQAVAKGILPVPTYVNAIYSFTEDIEKIQKKINEYKNVNEREALQKRLDDAKAMLEKADGLSKIFEKHIKNPSGKYIIFCKNIEHMKQMEKEAISWFKNVNENITISEIYSENDRELNKYTIDRFENSKDGSLKLLFSIQMLNEGLHIDDIDGVIMLRPTMSPIIYYQQLGRALSIGHNDHPIVFDIVNNISCHESIYMFREELKREFEKNPSLYNEEDIQRILGSFEIFDEVKAITDVLEVLELDSTFSWNNWYDLAKKYYQHYGDLIINKDFKTNDGVTYDEEGVSLGIWISNLRSTYKGNGTCKITDEQINLLNEIGMVWDQLEKNWEDKYELAKKYYEHYKKLDMSHLFKTSDGITYDEEGIAVGEWLSKMRESYRGRGNSKLTPEKIKRLEAIGMVWNPNEKLWEDSYNYAKDYYEKNGHLSVPSDHVIVTDDGEKILLGEWLINQRRRYINNRESMKEDRINKLNSIGMIWDPHEKDWLDSYELAKKYYEEHGNLHMTEDYVVSRNGKDFILGRWLARQRKALKNELLTDDQINKLNSIGMIWNAQNYRLVNQTINSKNRRKMEQRLLERFKSLLSELHSLNEFESKDDIDDINKLFNDSIDPFKTRK